MTRKALSKRVRFEVFKRDGFRCMYCGQSPPDVVLVVDHVVPVAEGGGDGAENLTTSCFACNAGKGAVPLGATTPQLDELAVREALQEVAERSLLLKQQIAAAEAQRNVYIDATNRVLEMWKEYIDDDATGFNFRSIEVFLDAGLELETICEAVRITSLAYEARRMSIFRAFKYFCGICWNKIRDGRESEGQS